MIALLVATLVLQLTAAETRGRQIFQQGTSAAGREVTAVIGGSPMPTPMACATCHGRDGRGRPEGGVRPANLEWSTLARASTARPAYDAPHLVRAITMGIDAGGRHLDPAMPRYRLAREDAQDLIAWLQRLGTLRDPGIDDTTIRFRIAGPLRATFQAWADHLNAHGGIYARQIALADAAEADADDTFAILGTPDEPLTREAIANDVPVLRIGTIAGPEGPSVFELGAATDAEVAALKDAAASQGATQAVVVLDPEAMPDPTRLALVPSAIASEALAHARGDAYIAARILPDDVDRDAAAPYRLSADHLVDQWSALALARLAERALIRAGRDVTRETFVLALNSERDAPTGFSPPITFAPAHHHGLGIIRILRFDHTTRQLTPLAPAPTTTR